MNGRVRSEYFLAFQAEEKTRALDASEYVQFATGYLFLVEMKVFCSHILGNYLNGNSGPK